MTDHHESPPEPRWSPETRTWVSLLLFAHLFAVFVAVTTYTRPSLLQDRLHGVFAPYLRILHLTALPVSYPFARFHLTHAGPVDVDFSVEVDVQNPDGSTDTLIIPPAVQPLVRFRRYQALANAAGALASDELGEANASILPRAIAGSVLAREGAGGGVLRIRGHGLADLEDMASLEAVAQAARENVTDVYEAQIIVSPVGIELLKKSTTLETAPVESTRRRSGEPTGKGAPRDRGRQQP
jgi:hypothetical protein